MINKEDCICGTSPLQLHPACLHFWIVEMRRPSLNTFFGVNMLYIQIMLLLIVIHWFTKGIIESTLERRQALVTKWKHSPGTHLDPGLFVAKAQSFCKDSSFSEKVPAVRQFFLF